MDVEWDRVSDPPLYFDREGNPMTLREWSTSFENTEGRRIGGTTFPESFWLGEEVWVSTMWLGLDHGFGQGPPLIFETMIFGGYLNEYQWRYATEEGARLGHERAVKLARLARWFPTVMGWLGFKHYPKWGIGEIEGP